MYFVDRRKIEQILEYMERLLDESKKQQAQTFAERLAFERKVHITVEAIIDAGNQMIDGFIMRDPGSYEDIIDILTDEKVLPESEKSGYKDIIRLRKEVVQNYTNIDHEAVMRVWEVNKDSLLKFPIRVRTYLDEELGPVSAFSSNKE
ncbi:type VII toxin-antitoxin system HepT family RNase toxin [Halobacillus campisalis]|uniref:DUF86 domain-containing protein n=1 Tax=Halobacillus campisalis TaxID=435909 RepID=A0ABW2K7T3_9BACI|nr:DUF86 domain-containing protein [Halobacillus campisalis]